MNRMTDQRLAVLEKELIRTPLQPGQQKSIELLQALKADRDRIAELEAALRQHVPKLTETMRMPNREWVSDEHNEAVKCLRAILAKREQT